MSLADLVLVKTDDFPIRHEGDVHSGKVRSVYWLNEEDSQRLAEDRGYGVFPGTGIGLMIISDRISAFECNWKARNGLDGVPGKGAGLNAVSKHWFNRFDEEGLAGNHILEVPHPLVWIVQKAEPVMVEAIARQYITGSMWRAYNERGEREFCGIRLPDGLKQHQRLDELLITPSTKGIIRGVPGVPEEDDVNITRQQIVDNYQKFGFKTVGDVDVYETRLREAFSLTERDLKVNKKLLADFKLEFGYVRNADGHLEMIYIDEPVTPDSARIWDADAYSTGSVIEESKEGFRQFLLTKSGIDPDILKNKKRMDERVRAAAEYRVPVDVMMEVADTYRSIAETIIGEPIPKIENPRAEIMSVIKDYDLAEAA